MSREQSIAEAFVGLSDVFEEEVDPVVLLDRLVRECVRLTSVETAGVLMITARGELRTMAVSDERAELLELFQLTLRQGPCVDCWRTKEPVEAPDLSAQTERWPDFVALAAAEGLHGAYALPLRFRRQHVGALNLLTDGRTALTAEELRLMQALADVATAAVVRWNAEPLRAQDVLTRTQAAVSAKAAVEMASGMLAAHAESGIREGARALYAYSARQGQRPTQVARALVSRVLHPGAVAESGPDRTGRADAGQT
ncbi:GAF domain-containing protein [Streptomyces sp. 549]|uniref:GAF domain-containing protein n=1 Tax=Streptomyces sp. 549 TaxID=3049076 RepID=UPI0024C42739|nr:GAF domain-containing protein [Streptomyces sp. 549]MDK1475816.1 GAF domain-containing protein [Streptomyces sp. 549]